MLLVAMFDFSPSTATNGNFDQIAIRSFQGIAKSCAATAMEGIMYSPCLSSWQSCKCSGASVKDRNGIGNGNWKRNWKLEMVVIKGNDRQISWLAS